MTTPTVSSTTPSAPVPDDASDSLSLFHPLVAGWFAERVGQPTDVQRHAWPRIAAGEHVLVTAPTGSGKTLTAFLWALDRLLTGVWEEGGVRVLYVSPLKALNSDIERNLSQPLAELAERFTAAGLVVPAVRAVTRSGDTPQAERRRMVRSPPEILITTPESLNILLTSQSGRGLLTGLSTVILDEIHAVAGGKRGTHLMTAVERLTLLSGEFQRVALSATVRPLERVAAFVGGFEAEGLNEPDPEPRYRARPVTIVQSRERKRYQIEVRLPEAAVPSVLLEKNKGQRLSQASRARQGEPPAQPAPLGGGAPEEPRFFGEGGLEQTPLEEERSSANFYWDLMVPDLRSIIERNRSTLLFANSRRTTEKLTRLLNDDAGAAFVYSHHGSLSKEVRTEVERRLKAGELAAIVATSSLELGIDIGDLDEVVLVQSPRSIASAVQRIGRAGHRVGEVSRASIFPTFGRDFLEAAVMAGSILSGEIEETQPVEAPLDVLAQVILSICCHDEWEVDRLYGFLKASYPYRALSRRQFDLVIEMLTGRYADARVRELKPRLALDRVSGKVKARPGTARLLYMAGGTIPDRGYYTLRVHGTMAKLGELDEEFVWERSVGDAFTLGAQSWRVRQITHNDVLVSPARGGAMAPFWRADREERGHFFSDRVGRFLEHAEARLADPKAFTAELVRDFCMAPPAAAELVRFLESQRAALEGPLPHRHRLVVERVGVAQAGDRRQVVLHTSWGGQVNRPLAIALAEAWRQRHPGEALDVFSDDDCLLLTFTRPAGALGSWTHGEWGEPGFGRELLSLVDPARVETLLRGRLESTGFFGAHFRQNAGRALLLPKAGFRHRTPLWLSRKRSKQLLESVRRYGDFPLTVETWRTCLRDEFDLVHLKQLLEEVESGEIALAEVATHTPSPFAAGLIWQQTNQLMYEDDTPETEAAASLSQELLRELVYSSEQRPKIPPELIAELERKLQRLHPGYAPQGDSELVEWVKERVLLPRGQWQALLAAVERDAAEAADADPGGERSRPEDRPWLARRLVAVRLAGAAVDAICAVETLPRLAGALATTPSALEMAALDGGPLDAETAQWLAGLPVPAGDADPAAHGAPLVHLVAEWLRFYGPLPIARITALFGDVAAAADTQASSRRPPASGLPALLAALVDDRRAVFDLLRHGGEGPELCDAEVLETLLRWRRAADRPVFVALPVTALPLFVAAHQGLTGPARGVAGVEALQARLEQLLGLPLPAAFWETEVLPARLDPYYPAWLDSLTAETELGWVGTGPRKLTFAFPEDLDLLLPASSAAPAGEAAADAGGPPAAEPEDDEALLASLFPDRRGSYEVTELARAAGLPAPEVERRLWELVWRGRVVNESWPALRRAALARFALAAGLALAGAGSGQGGRRAPGARGLGRRRPRAARWQPSSPYAGRWSVVETVAPPGDPLAATELAKERARLVLGRYGIVFRQLLARELPALQWRSVFRALRLMELSGEILAGYFFEGVPGPQFLTRASFRALSAGLPEDGVYWLNAADPASLCGADLDELKALLPHRHRTTHLAFLGRTLAVVSRRGGRELEIAVGPEHPRLLELLGFLKARVAREVGPRSSITILTINGEPAGTSPYLRVLANDFGVTSDAKGVRLWRRYAGAGR